MLLQTAFVLAAVSSVLAGPTVPSLNVPACPAKATAKYDKSVPDRKAFPTTSVDLCYTKTELQLTFTALNETNFYFNPSYKTNDPIWQYEVMEAFIAKGDADPSTYLELEVAPNNVTFQAFIYNPSKVRAAGAPMDSAFIQTPVADGLKASTVLNKSKKTWVSTLNVPLALFNVDAGTARGTTWRMNFFRTVVSPQTFPAQGLGAWSVPDEASFHKTPFFGRIRFV